MRTRSRTPWSVAAIAGTLALTAGLLPAPAFADPAETMPGLPGSLKIPGLSQLTGGDTPTIGTDGRTNINLPIVPKGGVRKQFANAPAIEQSTRPNCAPFVFVGVPGTFEINRDDSPTKPVGMLSKITAPLATALGNKFVVTMINYDADAGVNGTSYKTSVTAGTKKALATVTDVASRCPKSSIIIGGYSQGANVAGNLATDIGQKRTPVDPARIAGVVLVSDPQRTPNSNVIAGTNQARPDIPAFLENALGALTSNPSFAQLQLAGSDLLGANGKKVAGTISDLAGQLAGSLSSGPAVAGADPTEAPATTSLVPDASTSAEPDTGTSPAPSIDPGQTTPKIAGATWNGTVKFRQVDDPPPLSKADDELVPVKTTDTGQSSEFPAKDVGTIGNKNTGEWVLIGGLTRDEFAAKAKTGEWVYGRTAEQRENRRKVIDDLFLNGWDQCADSTLTQCRNAFVFGMPDGGNAKNVLISSSTLTTARDALVAGKDYRRPADSLLNRCLNMKGSACAGQVKLETARQRDYADQDENLPDDGRFDDAMKMFAAAQSYTGDDGVNKPLGTITDAAAGQLITGSGPDFCEKYDETVTAIKDGLAKHTPGGKVPDENYKMALAWNYAVEKWNGSDRIDLKQSPKDLTKAIEDTGKSDDTKKCYGWAITAFNTYTGYYNKGQIKFRDGYVADNNPAANGDTDKRNEMINTLYQHGGCGPVGSDKKTVAPNGTWTLAACRQYHTPNAPGSTNGNNQLTNRELQALANAARDAYMANEPDWNRELVFNAPNPARHVYYSEVGGQKLVDPRGLPCETFTARTCAILQTKITGPNTDTAPKGVTKMVRPRFPVRNPSSMGAPLIFDNTDPSETIDIAAGDKPADRRREGFIWATPEVVEAVKALDSVRQVAQSTSDASKQPKGVTSMIDPTTGTEKRVNGADEISSLLGQGWVWARTAKENEDRKQYVSDLFAYGGCKDLTYNDCSKKYLEAGAPEYATTNTALKKLADDTKTEVDQGRIKLGYQPGDLGAGDLSAKCGDKSAADCAGKKTTTPTEAGATTEEPEAETTAAPTGDEQPTTEGTTTETEAGSPATDSGSTPTTGAETTTEQVGTTTTEEPSDDSTTQPSLAGDDGTAASTTAGADSTTTAGSDNTGGDLTGELQNLITGGTTTTTTETDSQVGTSGEQVAVAPITQKAVAGGGLAGKRDADFGALTGRVVSLCVPGDMVCSLPENSELATDLVNFAKNVSLDFPDMVGDEGSTRMAGLLALQGLNTVSDITGMPKTKLSADTLQALMNIVAGGAMIAAQQPAGAALVAEGVSKLPDAMPEFFAQLQDVPALLRGFTTAPQNAMKNTGLDKVLARVNAAFKEAGMTSPLDVQKYPQAATALMQGLVKDNTGLVKMVTNPQYWRANAHVLYPQLKISGQLGSLTWVSQWIDRLAVVAKLK